MHYDPEVQYLGQSGITASCLEGILLFIEGAERFGPEDRNNKAYLVTHGNQHLFILPSWYVGYTVIRSGFRSGYSGEGPCGFSLAITALSLYRHIIREIIVSHSTLEKINRGKLATQGIDKLIGSQSGNASVSRYVWPQHSEIKSKQVLHELLTDYLREDLRFTVSRLHEDLAKAIQPVLDAPIEDVLRRGFIFLENSIKELAGVTNQQTSGVKLMEELFSKVDARISYSCNPSEQKACRRLFQGAFGLFRNQTAHNLTTSIRSEDQIRVLHFLDLLYRIIKNYCAISENNDEVHNRE